MSCFYTFYIAICKGIDRILGKQRRYQGAIYSMVGLPLDGDEDDELERESLLYSNDCEKDTDSSSDDEQPVDHPFKVDSKVIFHD